MSWDKQCPCGAERLSRAPICPACMDALSDDPDMTAYRIALRRGNWSEQTLRITALLEKAARMRKVTK